MTQGGKNEKAVRRNRRRHRLRQRILGSAERPRLAIFRSSKHVYAQALIDGQNKTVAAASTLDKEVQELIPSIKLEDSASKAKSTKSVLAAHAVGMVIAKRLKEGGHTTVVFDRGGYLYHGRVKGVADGARKGGLEF